MQMFIYNEDDSEIKYTITEDTVELYDNVIKGDAEHGFVVTNYYTPKGGDNPPPQTGDNVIISIISLILSLIGIGYSFYLRKRYN